MAPLGDRKILILALAVIPVILVGDAALCFLGHEDYSAEASLNGDTVDYEVWAEGTEVYTVLISDNGGYAGVETVYLYLDEDRPTNVPGLTDQEGYLEALAESLETRGVEDIRYLDADGLREALRGDLRSGSCEGKGLVVVSGALPDTVYQGRSSDAILRWMSAGGSLYWAGGLVGEVYSTEGSLVPVDGYEGLFFGAECLNHEGYGVTDEKAGGRYASMLSLRCNDVTYGVDVSRVGDGREALGIGFTAGGYTSVSLVQYGRGMVCVVGGSPSGEQAGDLAQVIASGMGPSTETVAYEEGSVTGGIRRALQVDGGQSALSAYVFIGESEVVYASLIRLRRWSRVRLPHPKKLIRTHPEWRPCSPTNTC